MENYEDEPCEISNSIPADPFEEYPAAERIFVMPNDHLMRTVTHARLFFDNYKPVIFTAQGRGISKAIAAAEKLKLGHFKTVYQTTKLSEMKTSEVWLPVVEGVDPLRVTISVPVIHIYLTVHPLDPDSTIPGYHQKCDQRKFRHTRISAKELASASTDCPLSPSSS